MSRIMFLLGGNRSHAGPVGRAGQPDLRPQMNDVITDGKEDGNGKERPDYEFSRYSGFAVR